MSKNHLPPKVLGWFTPEDALEKLTFTADIELLKKAVEMYGK